MKVSETEILDQKIKNIDEYKLNLLNKIIYTVVPYIKKDVNNSIVDLKKKKKELKHRYNEIESSKEELDNKVNILKRKKKINMLLNRALHLASIKALEDNGIKREISVMIKMIDDLPEEKLDFYVSEMMRIITEKFSQVDVRE